MSSHLCITVRFLQPFSHGRGDGGEPEWPPSPLRLFQALVAASAARWNERIRLEYAAPALRWLEQQSEPTIVASVGIVSDVKYRLYVPDNVGDKVAKSWSAGREGTIADYRTEKDVRPTHLKGEEVHYLYPLADEKSPFQDVLTTAARSITHLGWGVDMVAANASVLNEEDVSKLPGERWKPTSDLGGTQLRVPIVGTLDALGEKHEAFLNRLGPDGFTPVPPLSAFRVVGYRRATDIVARSFASFELLRPLDEIAEQSASNSKWRSFDTVRHSGTVAGMVRHAAAESARQFGWDDDRVTSFILGHVPTLEGQAPQATSDDRLMFLPLPSITPLKVESIRRVLVVVPTGDEHALRWVRQALSGRELIEECGNKSVAMLSIISNLDGNIQQYVKPSKVWSTVTPVIMPGYDDGKEAKGERILRRAFEQAGVASELVAGAELEWRRVGFRPGVELSTRYQLPETIRRPTYHVRVRFTHPVAGPLAVGAGRYRGFGIFAREDD